MSEYREEIQLRDIGSRINQIIAFFHTNKTKFAEKLRISQGYVSEITLGKKSLPDYLIALICLSYGINEEWLLTGEGEMLSREPQQQIAEYLKTDIFHMAGAGNPYELIENEPIDTVWLPKDFLNGNIVVVKVKGESMIPTLYPGAIVGVDKSINTIEDGNLYAVYYPAQGAVIKRLTIDPTGIVHIISDNRDSHIYKTISYNFKELDEHFVLGKVRWVIQKY